MLISLVICTYNRLEILKITLPSYLLLKIPVDATLEVIIVDNNSNDNTKSFIEGFIAKNQSEIEFKYVFEGEQGVSHARNTGYDHSLSEYIGYLDDECILPKEWLEIAVENIKLNSPAFLGGPYYGKFVPGTSSIWCKESFGDSYLIASNLPNGPMNGKYLSEGNMLVRRDIFDKIGLFDTELGMKGETIAYSEGPDFQRRFIKKYPNESIWYSPKLFVWHLIRDEKISIIYRFKEALIRGASFAAFASTESQALQYKSPILFVYYVVKAVISSLVKFAQSLFSKEHFFTLLNQDYHTTWFNIGVAWCRTKLLFQSSR